MRLLLLFIGLLQAASAAAAATSNGGFEAGLAGWRFWTREAGQGTAEVDQTTGHAGHASAVVKHHGTQDWSLEPLHAPDAHAGDLVDLDVWVKFSTPGSLTLCASTWGADGKVIDWSFGAREAHAGEGWQELHSRWVVPEGVVRIQPRLIGYGPVAAWVDDLSCAESALAVLRDPSLAARLTLTNQALAVTLVTSNATLVVTDQRTGREWRQAAGASDLLVTDASRGTTGLDVGLYYVPTGTRATARISLEPDRPELVVELSGSGGMTAPLRFPHPFLTAPRDHLILPMNEGISYPVEDAGVEPMRLIAYGGHGICMAFWGVTDGRAGQMAIIETPDDAAIQTRRVDERLLVAPEWDAQFGAFGYPRRLRYVFLDQGGYVAMAKRYRAHAAQTGLLKTLTEKRRANPNVDQLIGAVNVWCWDPDAPGIARELKKAGIERILWSNAQPPDHLRALNDLGVLTSRYDIYQDVMDPAQFPKLRWTHPDWTSAAWPKDVIRDSLGNWLHGWEVEARDNSMIPCAVICDSRALDYARQRVPAELERSPYHCRFIDTTTAAPWHECRDPNHPMTRTQSKQWKMELLRYMSEDQKLVTGCETGHDASVPFLHYFEGMLSLGPYRVPDAGRHMDEIWTNVPALVAKFQLGHEYRLPLWELVYHDCVVAQWYWGDYNNKLPGLWDKRDLFNVLYGTPPMFMFDRRLWAREKDRFARSYANTCPYVRRVGYSELTDHRLLTPDRAVQQTVFANGMRVTVNFGATSFVRPGGAVLPAGGFAVDEEQPGR